MLASHSLNGAPVAVNVPIAPNPFADRDRRGQFAVLAKLCVHLAGVIDVALGSAKPPRRPRSQAARLFYRRTHRLTSGDINLLVNSIDGDSLKDLYRAIERRCGLSAQERLSGIVDELGLDRTLNLLHAFEMTS